MNQTLDPTYLWFRNVTIISFRLQLFFRVVLTFVILLHSCILLSGFGIVGVSIILALLETLERVASQSERKIGKHFVFIKTYRQLEIINQVVNIIDSYIFPIFVLILIVVAVLMGYMIVKMTGYIPYALLVLETLLSAVIYVCILVAFPLVADLLEKSVNFIRIFKLQSGSAYRKKQLRSCRPLKIWAGPYFYIHKGTGITLLGLISYYTMSSIISV